VDIGITLAKFTEQAIKPFYLVVGDLCAQQFSSFNAVSSGNNTRLQAVTPNAKMQTASGQSCEIYVDNIYRQISNDAYVHSIASTAKEYYECTCIGAGVGYIDVTINQSNGCPSTKFMQAFTYGSLVFGGGLNSVLDLSTIGKTRNGSPSLNQFRLYKSGDNTAYSNKPVALFYNNSQPSPKAFEFQPKIYAACEHIQNKKAYITCNNQLFDGGIIGLSTSVAINAVITASVYLIASNTRSLVGELTVNPMAINGTLTSGNPTKVDVGSVYEFIITSATSNDAPLVFNLTPN